MENYESENTETEVSTTEDNGNGSVIALAITVAIGVGASIVLGIKNLFLKKELKEEREKNAAYQKLLRIHEAEIAELKNDKERREYRDRLCAKVQAKWRNSYGKI